MGTFPRSEPSRGPKLRQASLALCGVLLLGGCDPTEQVSQLYDSKLSLDNPIDWWHQLEGGQIAEDRPPPPGVSDPYPNLGQIPPRPTPTDPATRHALLAQLAGQRDRIKLVGAQDPIVWPVPDAPRPPNAPPFAAAPSTGANPAAAQAAPKPAPAQAAPAQATPAPAAAPPSDTEGSQMVIDAASAAPATGPASATPAPANDPHPPAAFKSSPRPSAPAVASGPIPALPTSVPALPTLPGLSATPVLPVVARARPSAQFSFLPGSAELPTSAEAALRALATRRAGGPVAIVAGGEAASVAPAAQQAALPLALRRTGAITAALIAAGVPAGSIRAEAVAPGREASARLVD